MINRPRLRLPLRVRLVMGYSVILLLFVVFGGFTIYQFNQIIEANRTVGRESQAVLDAEEMSRAVLELIVAMDKGIMLEDTEQFAEIVNPALEQLDAKYVQFRETLTGTEQYRLDLAVVGVTSFVEPMITQAKTDSWSVMRLNRVAGIDAKIDRVEEILDQTIEMAQDNQANALERAQEAQESVYRTIVLTFVLAGLISVYMVVSTIRSITSSVQVLSTGAHRLAAGELDQRVVAETQDEMGQLAYAFNQMAEQLQSLYGSLEQRVADRTRELEQRSEYLEASAEVSRAATSILDVDELIRRAVESIRDRFDLYYVGLFQLDETREWVVLRAGTGEAGRAMLARGHRIKVGEGMVGWCVANAQWRVALEVGEDAMRLATTELPETRSEAALPLRSRGQVLGALTVQSDRPGAFDHDTMVVLQTMADQVAVALDNARLFAASQARLEELRRAYGEFGRQAWAQLGRAKPGYRYTQAGGVSVDETWYPEMKLALQNAQTVQGEEADPIEVKVGQANPQTLAVPIKVQDHVIGVIGARKSSEGSQWTPQEVTLLETLVERIGTTLEGARLYQGTQRRAARERLVAEITDRLRASTQVDTILQTAISELGRGLGAAEGLIQLQVVGGASAPSDEQEVEDRERVEG